MLLALCFFLFAVWRLADRVGWDPFIRQAALPMAQTSGGPVPATASPPRNCTQARAMGLRNIPRGSLYYATWLDGDNDGVACEWR